MITSNELLRSILPLITDEDLKRQFVEYVRDYDKRKKDLKDKCEEELRFDNRDNCETLLSSINIPETEIPEERGSQSDKKGRDTSRYIFNGVKYNKRDLVYACFKNCAQSRDQITIEEMKQLFPGDLQGSFGVFKTQKDIDMEQRDDAYMSRFFEDPVEIDGEKCFVCREWSKDNISRFYDKMRENGLDIEKVDK